MKQMLYLLCFLMLPAFSVGLAVLSIDFGGEFMKIAIVKPGVPMEIVLNKESQRKTAALISIKNGERMFGEQALYASVRSPKTTYRYLHEVLGKQFENPIVAEFQKKYPYYELEKDPDTGSVLFVHEDNIRYSPEELIAMILQKAKEYAETFAEQPISEAVITVPVFFNQAERRAMLRAGELAGLKVLQLISDNTAVALNYGVFRRKSFNTTPSYYMFFDMGASSTTATIVEYQTIKTKSPTSGLVDTYPQLTIKGIGFDQTLGGIEFQMRLRNHLANAFNKHKKTKKNIFDDDRALQKLYKEAGRVKQVLSANVEHFAQVENLLDDEDFREKVIREEYEELCNDLFDRIEKTIEDALSSSHITMSEISEVILMGGGTRVPKVQEVLKKVIGREELGKGINTDEAAALGAVYQAAHLGKGFKVQKFGIKEAVIYPIQVDFERVTMEGDSPDASKIIHRVLFARMNTYPQKKVLTFNKHFTDFGFTVTHGDLSFLSEKSLKELGSTTLASVKLSGIDGAFSKQDKDAVSKGIKAHFRLDESGLLYLDKVEATFEKQTVEEPEEESTLSKLGKSFSNLFGTQTDTEENKVTEGDEKDEQPQTFEEDLEEKTLGTKSNEEKDGKEPTTEQDKEKLAKPKKEKKESKSTRKEEVDNKNKEETTRAGESKSDSQSKSETESKLESNTNQTDESTMKKVEKIIKNILIREVITTTVETNDLKEPSVERLKLAKKHLDDLKKRDDELQKLDSIKNEIESFVFDAHDKLEQKDYLDCSTQEERIKIKQLLINVNEWMEEQTPNTPYKEYESKMNELYTVTNDVYDRVLQMRDRPAAMEALNARVNHTEYFLEGMKNFTGEDQPFTQIEFNTLENLLRDVKKWNETVTTEQANTPLYEKPKYSIDDVVNHIQQITREVNYLIGKVKSFKPKTKPKSDKSDTDSDKDELKFDDSTLEQDGQTSTTGDTSLPKEKGIKGKKVLTGKDLEREERREERKKILKEHQQEKKDKKKAADKKERTDDEL